MKKSILLFAGILLASASQAQITLSSGSYSGSLIGTDSLSVTAPSSTFPSLTAATNGSWDLSTVTDTTPVLYAYRVNSDTTTTGTQFADSNFYSFGGFSYQGNVQSSITSSGLLEYGVDVDSASFTTSGATIFVPIQHNTFTSPLTVIQFPATMGSSWSSVYQSDFDYSLTFPPLYSNAPGIVKAYINETDNVVGWGQMRVKSIAGSPSSWFNVLQVQTMIVTVDTFYLNGGITDPGLSTLLGLLGVSQGQSDTTYQQNYYRSGEVTPFAKVTYPNSAYSSPSQATTHTQRLINTSTGVANVANNTGVSIYPNPVTDNLVSIDVPAIGGAWSYELIDMSGKTLTTGSLQTNGTHAQLSLPAAAASGIYYIRLNNNGAQFCVKSIDVVK